MDTAPVEGAPSPGSGHPEPRWPFIEGDHTASRWIPPPIAPEDLTAPALTYNETLRLSTANRAAPAAQPEPELEPEPESESASHVPDSAYASASSAPTRPAVHAPREAPAPLGEPLTPDVPPVSVEPEPAEPATAAAVSDPDRQRVATPSRPRRFFAILLTVVWLAAVAVSAGRLAAAHDLWSPPNDVTRAGSVVATWLAIVMLARRSGGRWILIGLFAGLVLGLVTAYPENWALAGAAVTAASVHGILGMILTRPAKGLRTLRELVVSAVVGAAGAVVVSGYDVVLRPFRFRVMVLTLVLLGGFALAWRLGQGARSIGRRGAVLIGGGVLVIALSIAYTQAIRAWGSPGVLASMTDLKDALDARLGAVPRPVEALVGFPALVWGVAIRSRRRQGWWMCAFGGLGAAGVATSLIQPTTPFVNSVSATGYDVLIGGLLGLVLVLFDRILTGRGRRAAATVIDVTERPEPARFSPLL